LDNNDNKAVLQAASPEDLDAIVSMLDQEFIYRNQRTISFVNRFPGVYGDDNINNIYIIKECDRIVSSVAVKHRQWLDEGFPYNIAMIGGVCTAPVAQGRGFASIILRYAKALLKEAGIDYAVLWTTNTSFYEKLGWHHSNRGLFGTMIRQPPKTNSVVSCEQLLPEDVVHLEEFRSLQSPNRLIRKAIDYQTIPIPTHSVELFTIEGNFGWKAYAIVGRLKDIGYVYEVLGDSATFPALLSAIAMAYKIVHINDYEGSPTAQWLSENGIVHWTAQNLAMWQALSPRLTIERVKSLYISFIDRI